MTRLAAVISGSVKHAILPSSSFSFLHRHNIMAIQELQDLKGDYRCVSTLLQLIQANHGKAYAAVVSAPLYT